MTASGLRELLVGDKLTDGEILVLHGAALGETVAETAKRVHLAPDTVGEYRKTAAAKLNTKGITRAVVVAIAAGVLNLDRLVDE